MKMRAPTLSRRIFLAGLPLVAVPARASVPEGNRLAFRAFRNGSEIGTHVVTFEPKGEDLEVRIAVDLAVKFGPITVYRYSLRGQESWRRGVLMAASADGVDGGKKVWMRAARRDGRLRVEGDRTVPYVAPEASLVSSHWRQAEVEAPMVNLQNGELLDFTVARKGVETIEARGRRIEASHFSLTGPATLNLWYDSANIWSALHAVAEDGSDIVYRQA